MAFRPRFFAAAVRRFRAIRVDGRLFVNGHAGMGAIRPGGSPLPLFRRFTCRQAKEEEIVDDLQGPAGHQRLSGVRPFGRRDFHRRISEPKR